MTLFAGNHLTKSPLALCVADKLESMLHIAVYPATVQVNLVVLDFAPALVPLVVALRRGSLGAEIARNEQ